MARWAAAPQQKLAAYLFGEELHAQGPSSEDVAEAEKTGDGQHSRRRVYTLWLVCAFSTGLNDNQALNIGTSDAALI